MLIGLILLLSGFALAFAFAPFNFFILAFICPALFLYYCYRCPSMLQAFLRGLLFGLGFYAAGLYWIYISIHNFGGAGMILGLFISLLLILFLALFSATLACVLYYVFKRKSNVIVSLAGFPALWVIWEWLRELPFNGFPWLYIGYTQLNTPLRGFAPWIGVYGISFMVCLLSAALMLIVLKQSSIRVKLGCLMLLVGVPICGWLLSLSTWTQAAGPAIKVSLIQGNIAQSLKWQPHQLSNALQRYLDLTKQHLDSKLIIWPEASVAAFPQQVSNYIANVSNLVQQHQGYLIFGALLVNDKQQFFNGLLLVGSGRGQYAKQHLVPFGEYTPLGFIFNPLMQRLNIPMSDFTPGSKQQALLKVGDITIRPFICYEIAFPQEVLEASKHSQLLVSISDDSWFGRSSALWQHFQMAQMRALETGRYLLLATNTGITGIIDPQGHVRQTAPLDQATVLTGMVNPMQGLTPLMRWNYYPVILLILLLLASVWYSPKIK